MKKILLTILSVYITTNIYAQDNEKIGVLAIPTFFDKYIPKKTLDKVYKEKEGYSLTELIKDTKDNRPWVVFSDRSDNSYYDDYIDRVSEGELKLGKALYVYDVKGFYLQVGEIPIEVRGEYVHNIKGWMPADRLILSPKALIDDSLGGGLSKGMVLTTINSFDRTKKNAVEILKKKHYYKTPDCDESKRSKLKAKKFTFLFIIKETNDSYLLSDIDDLSTDIENSTYNIKGWLPKQKFTRWNHRVCLEPGSLETLSKKVYNAYKDEELYVIDEEQNFETYLGQGSLINNKWAIKKIRLTEQRPFAREMRMPILPDWPGKTKENFKVACIAQMVAYEEEEDNTTIIVSKEKKLAELETRLAEVLDKANKINILFVLDGTKSMKDYGPAVARSIVKFIKLRNEKYSNDKYQFALAIYRHYDDDGGNPEDFEYISFKNEDGISQIIEKLESGIKYESKNGPHYESHYYGMTQAIKRSNFNPKETNIMVLVGDAGNENHDKNNLTADKVSKLLIKNNINLISFQTNYQNDPAFFNFNDDVMDYLGLIGEEYAKTSKGFYTGIDWSENKSSKTIQLEYIHKKGKNVSGEKAMKPFGLFAYANLGEKMDLKIFENNLISTLDDYANSLSVVEKYLTLAINGETNDIARLKGQYIPGQDSVTSEFPDDFDEYLSRQGFSPVEIEALKHEGEISAHGYLSVNIRGIEESAFVPVIFISKNYKDELSAMLNKTIAAEGERIGVMKRTMYESIVSIMKSVMGEELSESVIEQYTFNQVWKKVLGVEFTGNTVLRSTKIHDILSMKQEDFKPFYLGFAQDVKDFQKWDSNNNKSRWEKANQVYYWIPLDQVPGCN